MKKLPKFLIPVWMAAVACAQANQYLFDSGALDPVWQVTGGVEAGNAVFFARPSAEAARKGAGGLLLGKSGEGSGWSSARLALKENLVDGSSLGGIATRAQATIMSSCRFSIRQAT